MREYIVEAPATFRGRVKMWVHAESREQARELCIAGHIEDVEVIDNGSSSEPNVDCSELEVREAE